MSAGRDTFPAMTDTEPIEFMSVPCLGAEFTYDEQLRMGGRLTTVRSADRVTYVSVIEITDVDDAGLDVRYEYEVRSVAFTEPKAGQRTYLREDTRCVDDVDTALATLRELHFTDVER